MAFKRLISNENGLKTWFTHNGDTFDISKEQDITAQLNLNKAAANLAGKKVVSEVANHVAHIPAIIIAKWLNEEGWNAMHTHDPDVQKKLFAKLNSSEYRHLRTNEMVI